MPFIIKYVRENGLSFTRKFKYDIICLKDISKEI